MKMNPFYEWWWRALMDLRPIVRYMAERLPRLASKAVRFRSLLHLLAGNPVQVLIAWSSIVALVVGAEFRFAAGGCVLAWLIVEAVHQVALVRGGPAWLMALVGWREAWRFRRRFPSQWSVGAAKTARVQAEVGTSKEPIASALLRPVADHPKMSWLPTVQWPIVSWWVGPPPGRSFSALDEMTSVLAANTPRCVAVEVDYSDDSVSYGRLVVSYARALGRSSQPGWPSRSPDPTDLPDLAGELDRFDRGPHLRLVPDREVS